MIEITVKGIPLTLYRDTTLNVELNNALFASPDVEGDITYSFDLPVQGNELTLDFVHLPWRGYREFSAVLSLGGILSFKGRLLVQKSSKEHLTAAIALSPYPKGFGKRSFTQNEDEEIIVSNNKTEHSSAWRAFLKESLSNPDIKFAPFINEEGYGSENEDFGSWNGKIRSKVVNAVFFDQNRDIIDSDDHPFSKVSSQKFWLKNEDDDSFMERNQLALCPQIRFSRLLKIWCKNAGYRFINHIGDDLSSIFMQSQRSLDGTRVQYLDPASQLVIYTTASIIQDRAFYYCNSFGYNGVSQDSYVHNGMVFLPSAGWWTLHLKASLSMPENFVSVLGDKWSKWVMLAGAFLTGGGSIPIGGADLTALVITLLGSHEYNFKNEKIHFRIYSGSYTVTQVDNGSGVLYSHDFPAATAPSIDFCTDIELPSTFADSGLKFIFYVKKERKNKDPEYFAIDQARLDIKLHQRGMSEVQGGFNIWRKSFSIPECCPDINNSTFLKTSLESLGLCFFVSSSTGLVEFVPFANIRDAHCIDLTEYELVRETEMNSADGNSRKFRLKPLTDEGYKERLRLPDTESELPEVLDNIDHFIFSKKTNTLYKAETVECDDNAWSAQWVEHAGNPDSLLIEGKDDGESKTEPAVAIPHQRVLDGIKPDMEEEQMHVANFTIYSDMYNMDDVPSELILTLYRGYKDYDYEHEIVRYYRAFEKDSQTWVVITEEELNEHSEDYDSAYYDHTDSTKISAGRDLMLPVHGNEFSLKAKGENSLGEKYIRPVLELFTHRMVTYKFRIPYVLVPEIDNLLRPQHAYPINQTRFLMVNNVKSVPKRIQFQFENSDISGTVLCQIEAVKLH